MAPVQVAGVVGVVGVVRPDVLLAGRRPDGWATAMAMRTFEVLEWLAVLDGSSYQSAAAAGGRPVARTVGRSAMPGESSSHWTLTPRPVAALLPCVRTVAAPPHSFGWVAVAGLLPCVRTVAASHSFGWVAVAVLLR
ncbi:hypothetical protein [Dactylosporangium sp. NPDC000521]|uniref:hypothetical protein n=1 Tax=Dactylosporangium sp. NPDC000521 TaxID=3363975 RepID=UPI0036933CD0